MGLVVNAALSVAKLLAGLLGHSFALVADAVESLVDIVGSFVIWGGLRYGARAPDEDHPFGHGKAEALAALAVSILVIGAGVAIAVQAVRHVATPHAPPAPFTLIVLLVVVALKEGLYRFARRSAAAAGSSAGYADAWHHRSDAITSAFAFVGIGVALLGGPSWAPADDWAALAASAVILSNGWRLTREPLAELMDRNAADIAARAAEVTGRQPGVLGVERREARKVGRSYRVILHVEVDPAMSVAQSHALTGRIKHAVRSDQRSVSYVLIHVEPHRGPG
ncbi:MAG: cation transporter [Phycisphaerales bacterium]|nr:MAG: cation transporter [Phycisphaerales bacterium]